MGLWKWTSSGQLVPLLGKSIWHDLMHMNGNVLSLYSAWHCEGTKRRMPTPAHWAFVFRRTGLAGSWVQIHRCFHFQIDTNPSVIQNKFLNVKIKPTLLAPPTYKSCWSQQTSASVGICCFGWVLMSVPFIYLRFYPEVLYRLNYQQTTQSDLLNN